MTGPDDREPRVAAWLRREAPARMDDSVLREITGRIETTPQRGRGRTGALAAAAVFAGAVAMVITLVTLNQALERHPAGSEDRVASLRPIASSTAGATASASVRPTPSPTENSNLAVWPITELATPVPGAYGGVWPLAITTGGPGLVAVGRATPCCADASYDDEAWETAIWTSRDAHNWDLVPNLESFGKSGLNSVATDASGTMVAVGYDVLPPSDEEPVDQFRMAGSVWRSTNGIDWIRMEDFKADALRDVVSTPRGWVVGGSVDGHPALFTTSDGLTWMTHRFDGLGAIEDLAVSDDGTTVATGCIAPEDGAICDSKAYASNDDSTWTEANAAMVFVGDVVWWQDEFVAVGSNDEGTAVQLWTSPDGIDWTARSEVLRSVAARIDVLVPDGDRLIGAGSRLGGDPATGRPSIWVSADIVVWEPLAQLTDPEGGSSGQVSAVHVAEGDIVVMGTAFSETGNPYLWVGDR